MNFDVVGLSGLTQEEFAALAGVSRVTVNTWIGGHMQPHRYIKAQIEQLLWEVEIAVATGALPLDKAIQKSQRVAEARKAIGQTVAPIDAAIAAVHARAKKLR